MTLQPFKNEQLNYFKFAFVVLHEFPKVLRQAFKTRWDTLKHLHGFQPWDDSVTVRNLFHTTEGGSTKVPTHLPYDDWDCTALFQATIFAKSFSIPDGKGIDRILSDLFVKPLKLPPKDLHTSVISSTGNDNESFTLAIDQLRRLRNEVCHPTIPEIPKATFDKYIQLTKDAFQVLGVSSSSVDTIGSLPDADFPIERVHKLQDEIKKELQAECAFLRHQENYLMAIRSDIAAANQERRNETERAVTEIKEEIQRLENQVQEQSNQAREKDAASAAQDSKQGIQELRKQLELATLSIPQQEISQRLAELTQKIDDITIKTTKQEFKPTLPKSNLPSMVPHFTGRKEECIEEHLETADSYHSLGVTQHSLGDFVSALESNKRALNIRLNVLGEEHSQTAHSYHSLGVTQHSLGDFVSALESNKRALNIRLKVLGEEHSETADSYHSLGVTYHSLGDFASALESNKRALNIRLNVLGEEH